MRSSSRQVLRSILQMRVLYLSAEQIKGDGSEAQRMIHIIVTDFEAGQILTGKVVSIKEFGAFLEFAPGKEGMVHISKICKRAYQSCRRCSDTW